MYLHDSASSLTTAELAISLAVATEKRRLVKWWEVNYITPFVRKGCKCQYVKWRLIKWYKLNSILPHRPLDIKMLIYYYKVDNNQTRDKLYLNTPSPWM